MKEQLGKAGFDPNLFREFYQQLFFLIQEIIYMMGVSPEGLRRRTKVLGFEENLKPYIDRGEGALVLTAHLGNWEWMLGTADQVGIPGTVIVKRTKSKVLNALMTRFREKFGTEVLWEEASWNNIRNSLNRGRIVAVVLDQYMGPPVGIKTNFFGRGAGTMKALALLAKRYKRDIVPAFCYRTGFLSMRVEFWKPIRYADFSDVELETQVYSSVIEEAVKKAPAQWFWIHRRWKGDVSPLNYSEDKKATIGKKIQRIIGA